MGRVILLRHAKVNIDNPKVYAKEMQEFIGRYNSLEIEKTKIPNELKELINSADFFIISKLKRTKDTLQLFNKEPNLVSSLFNEADLPYPNIKGFKLPAKIWAVIFRVSWLFGYSENATSYKDTKVRASIASNKLIELASSNKTVVVVGHGIMNKIIIKELKKMGLTVSKSTGHANLNYTILN